MRDDYEIHHGLFIEMKIKGNKQQENQKTFEQNVVKEGYRYVVCYSFDEFEALIKAWLKV